MEEIEDASQFGVRTNFRKMSNGELRLGLLADDGSSYTRTVSTVNAWQNSHYHEEYQEIYLVQQGSVIYAALTAEKKLALKVYSKDKFFVVPAGTSHNIFQFAGTVMHNIKFGKSSPDDWHAAPELDVLVETLSENDLLKCESAI